MQEIIQPKLDASRKELLDLSLRNTLLNYKTPKARGLQIVQEKSISIYDILVKQAKAMTFLSKLDKTDEDESFDLPELAEPEIHDAYNDTRLQTNESEQKLQAKILNTYYFAKTSIEEQGVNILYLALGMLNWYEKGNTEDTRSAPLVLIPVTLERSSANERFRLRYSGAEIGSNLSLRAKLMVDFNISIPDFPEAEEFDVDLYLKVIQEKVKHLERWKVEDNAIELGFFSFGKFMIYHDLDSSKWPDERKPYNHPILQSLFSGGFREPQPTATEAHHLDEETNSNDLFHVVDADSSQVLAMLAVHEGRNMVIQGPPGTGKSQTITNIIANAIGHGKKVLFVAEKMAALEVVKRRLDSINLGEACLELHSHKANKRILHDELKRVLELGKPSIAHLENEIQFLAPVVNELNTYCSEINKEVNKSGVSAQEVIGHLLKIQLEHPDYKFPKVPIEHMDSWDHTRIREAEQVAEQIQTRLKSIGQPEKMLFYGTELTVFLPSDEDSLKNILHELLTHIAHLQQQADEIASFLRVDKPQNETDIKTLINISHAASQSPDLHGIRVKDHAWVNNAFDIDDLLKTGARLKELHNEYSERLIPEAWEQNVLDIRQDLMTHGNKWYKFLIGDYKRSNKKLAALLNVSLPADLESKLKYIDVILEWKRLSTSLQSLEPLANQLLGNRYQKLRTDWASITKVAAYLKSIHLNIQDTKLPLAFITFLQRHEQPDISKANEINLTSLLDQKKQTSKRLFDKMAFRGDSYEDKSLADQAHQLQQWIARLAEIHQAVSWNVLVEMIKEKNHIYMLQVIKGWEDAALHLKTAVQKTWYEYLIEQAMLSSYALRKFERSSHEEVIERFIKLDLLNQQYNRAKVALKHWESVPKQDGGGQVNILRSEFNKRSRHMPIRKLMQEAGLAIQAIKPVIMMSPMSIANFLPPDSIDFDLVIFDEASQVRPVDALGALLRGQQLIVVGDTKQMPPTSFFDRLNTEMEDEENVTADMQSILGMCDGQGAPQRMLRWHYRSRHESLISLSNQEFYENKLVIFPSPGSKYHMGLAFHYLPDTIYDKGKTRTNPKEAEKVAEAVFQHAVQHSKLSLGVVAFSTAQMQAIQDALEIKRRRNPDLENFFRSHPNEPFFVKNLENVQGDERDVIFISIGYGRVEDGKVPMNFGPLNSEGGERRLNVLITRAKRRCEVFTNITSEDIKPGPDTKFGVRALKSFLYFAEHGKFENFEEEVIVKQQPFEEVVARRLQDLGYTVRQKVGSAGFQIDLAVVDTDHPGRYLLGISCDGQSYKAAKSARDRDRLRTEVLLGMGWKMYRVWSTDWFRNPEKELKLLVEAIEKAKSQAELDDAIDDDIQEESKGLLRDEPEEMPVLIPIYKKASLPAEVSLVELHTQPLDKLARWITDVVKVESPVHFEEVARRIADANGVSKIGTRIRSSIIEAAEYARHTDMIKVKGEFLWHPEMKVPYIRERSAFSVNSKKIQFIAPEEIHIGIKKVVESSIAIQPEVAISLISKLFGFFRVTEDMKKYLLESIESAITRGVVIREGEFLKVDK